MWSRKDKKEGVHSLRQPGYPAGPVALRHQIALVLPLSEVICFLLIGTISQTLD